MIKPTPSQISLFLSYLFLKEDQEIIRQLLNLHNIVWNNREIIF